MTYQDAIKAGYKDADQSYERGYVSRKADLDSQPVHVAGGSRKGEMYVLIPSWRSTQYCVRQYLRKASA